MKILVLGCGPAGLLAAHAASYAPDAYINIVSIKQRSELYGCQYLHGPIPDLALDTTTVSYELRGSVSDYQRKVYGDQPVPGGVSPAALTGSHPAWDIRQAYEQLWERYAGLVDDFPIDASDMGRMLSYYAPDLVVNTIPLPLLCAEPTAHSFTSQQCWAMGDAPERGQFVPIPRQEDTIVCDGTRDVSWYRTSTVFGYSTAEWSGLRPKPPLEGVVAFNKPLATTCDCWPDMLRVGRYGSWTKGALSHEAFNTTIKKIQERVHA